MSRPTNRAHLRAPIAAAALAALIGGARGESRAAAPAGVFLYLSFEHEF